MYSFKTHFFATIFLISFVCSANAENEQPTTQPTEQPGWFKRNFDAAVNTTENIYDNGRLSVILSGYAYHGRSTYTAERISELNEKTWGLGLSKELRDEKDNEESLQILILSDSHKKPQITAGYSYQWMKPLWGNWEAGIGFTAGLISRVEIYNGIPFPGILPQFSIGTRDIKLIGNYLPTINGNGNGDVLFLALRVNLK